MIFMGMRLREARARRGLSQEELAAELGISKAAVSAWEQGKSQPIWSRLERLGEVLGVEPAWLAFGGEHGDIAEILSRLSAEDKETWIAVGKAMATKKD